MAAPSPLVACVILAELYVPRRHSPSYVQKNVRTSAPARRPATTLVTSAGHPRLLFSFSHSAPRWSQCIRPYPDILRPRFSTLLPSLELSLSVGLMSCCVNRW